MRNLNMKKSSLFSIFFIGLILVFYAGCWDSSSKIKENTSSEQNISGVAQKGPFAKGAVVKAYELVDGVRSGRVVQTTTSDNKGDFNFNSLPWTNPTQIVVTGSYFNEVTGEYSSDGNLSVVIKGGTRKIEGGVNVNILTQIASSRIIKLLKEGKSFDRAYALANTFIKEMFNLDLPNGKGPESLDLTKTDKPDNVKLLQISASLLSTQNPRKVLDNIGDDAKDGTLDGEGELGVDEIKDKIKSINLLEVAENIDSQVGSQMATHIEQMLQGVLPIDFELKFVDQFDVEPSTQVNSNIVTLLGFDGNVTLKVLNANAMINGSSILHAGDTISVPAGTTIKLITIASSDYNTKKTATLRVNNRSFYFSTTTKSNVSAGDYNLTRLDITTFSTALQPVVKGLQELNISTPQEFAHRYQKVKPIDLFLQLKEKDSSISSEMFVSMMKKLETKVVIEPLVKDGNLTQKEFNSIAVLNRPISNLKQRELRTFSIDTNDSVLLDKFYEQQLFIFNQELEARGKEKLNLVEFKNLVTTLHKVHPLFNFYPTTLQNIEVNSTQIAGKFSNSSMKKFSKPMTGQGTVILNPVDEYNGSISVIPSDYLNFKPHEYSACKNIAVTYPQQVMGTFFTGGYVGQTPLFQEVNSSSSLMGDENQQRYFQINQKGVAHIRVHNKSTTATPFMLKHYNTNIVNQNIPANTTVYLSLPILENDLCVPYYMNRDNTNLDVTIVDIEKPIKMVEEFDNTNGRYNLTGDFSLSGESDHKQGHLFQFEIFRNNQENPQRTLYIKTEDTSAVDYLLVSPDGEITLQYSPLIGGDTSIDFTVKDGKWLLYAIPTGSIRTRVDSEKLHISKISTVGQNSSQSSDDLYKISLYNTRAVNLKKFIIGELKEIAFSQDGEDAANNAGELSINLHTNVAPKLNMKADVAKYYEEPEFKALDCWIKNGRDLSAFYDERCQDFKANFNSIIRGAILDISDETDDIDSIIGNLSFNSKERIMKEYETDFKNKIADATFRELVYTDNSAMYNNWTENVVQINSMQFPLSKEYHYKILDTTFSQYTFKHYVPKVPVNMPILGVTKERLALSTAPISFNYEAVDDDEVDQSAKLWAVLKYTANQALAAVPPQNYMAFLCNTVNTMKELRQIEIDGEDDPLGDASVHLNRFSSQDSFYGLMHTGLNFGISGFANIPNHYTSYDKGLDYASIACGVGAISQGSFAQAYSLANNIGALIDGDTITAQHSLDSIKAEMLSKVEAGSEEYNNIITAFNELKRGNTSVEVFNLLKKSLESYSDGYDIFKTLDDVQSDARGLGGAGHNVMRTDGVFFFSPFSKAKTYAKMQFKEVNALPVSKLSVALDGITIYSDMETGDDSAEVELIGRVGVIGDKTPSNNHVLYDNGSHGYKTYTNTPFSDRQSFYREYKGIHDGDTLPVEGLQLYSQNFDAENNMAAIYVEIGLYEDDVNTIDNDMIGVHTNTFTLENLYNSGYYERRENLGNNRVRLYFSRPVYNERNLESVVEFVDTKHASEQKAHNRERLNHPSALIKYHIDITLGKFKDYPVVDIDRNATTGESSSKEKIDIDKISLHDVSHISNDSELQIKDIYKNEYILTYDTKGTLHVVKITSQHTLQKIKDINASTIDAQNAELFKVKSINSLNVKRDYLDAYFVDETHLAILRTEGIGGQFNSTLNLVSIGGEEQNASLIISAPLSGKPRFMRKVKDDNQGITVIVNSTDTSVNAGKSKLSVYRIEPNKITNLSHKDTRYRIEDILRLDKKSVIMKSKEYHKKEKFDDCFTNMEHCGQEGYIEDASYLETYHIGESGELSLIDRREISNYYSTHHILFSYIPILRGNIPFMRNVNYSKSNRKILVGKSLFGLNYQQLTENYTVGERITKYESKMQENPHYAYELKGTKLDAIIDSNGTKRVVRTPLEKFFDDDSISYYSVYDFQFLDDTFVLATQRVGHKGNANNGYSESRLSLIDTQYDGRVGISGDDFNKTIILNHSNTYRHTVHFTLDANSSILNDVNISFKIEDADTNQTIFSGKDTTVENLNNPATYWYKAKLSCVANQCSIDLNYNKPCTNKKHNYTIVVSYRGYESTAHFSAYLKETEPYLGDDKNINIIRINPTSYSSLNTYFVSYPSVDKDPNSCVNRFEVIGKPSWITSGTLFSFTSNKKVLELKGTPTLSDIGDYSVTVKAFNDDSYDSAVLHVHVLPPDTVPDSVSDITQTDLNVSAYAVTTVQIKGINAPVRLKIRAGGEYSLDGGHSWLTTPSSVTNGTVIKVRQQTSSQYSTTQSTTLYINNVDFFTFITITKADPVTNDTTPDAFSFTDINDVELNSEQRATVTISGITKESPLSIVGGEYSLDGGKTWSNANTTVQNGAVVTVRHQSSTQYLQSVDTTLTVGGVSDTFTTTTKAQETPKLSLNANTQVSVGDSISFTPQNSGGSVTNWSINSVPNGLIFDPTHGILSGTVKNKGEYDINITASNSGGADSLVFTLTVSGKNGPYIDGGFHSLDERVMSFTFTDDSNWRSAVTSVDITDNSQNNISLTTPNDYNLSAGVLKLYVTGANSVPTTSGQWQITLHATDYEDVTIYAYIDSASLDANATASTFSAINMPFARTRKSTIVFNAVDRFGNRLAYSNAKLHFNVIDNNSTHIEPYKVDMGDGIEKLLRPTPLHPNINLVSDISSDENGTFHISIFVPEDVDLNDGFRVEFKTDSGDLLKEYNFQNSSTSHLAGEWSSRFNLKYLGLNSEGKPRYTLSNMRLLEDNETIYMVADMYDTTRVGSFGYTYGPKYIELMAFDSNGVQKWESNISISEDEKSIELGAVALKENRLYVGLSTNGTLSGEVNSGAWDSAFVVVDSTNGSKITAKSWGDGTNKRVVGIKPFNHKVVLYASNTDQDTPESWKIVFTQINEQQERYSIDTTLSNTDNNMAQMEVYEDNTTVGYAYATHRVVANVEDMSTLWQLDNDNRVAGSSDYNYATISNIWTEQNSSYIAGSAKKGFFDYTMLVDSIDYTTLTRRTKNGAYLWSHVFDEQPKGSKYITRGGMVHNVVYVAYQSKESCSTNSGDIDCDGLRLATLNNFTGELLHSTKLWKTDFATQVVNGHTIHYSRTLRPYDTIVSQEGQVAQAVYIAGTTDGKFSSTPNSSGVTEYFIMKLMKDDSSSDNRAGYQRVNRIGIVNDYDHKLQWLDNNVFEDNWNDRLINPSRIDGIGWRVPTLDELLSIIDLNNDAPALKNIFQFRNYDTIYWSNDEVDNNNAGAVNFDGGGSDAFPKSTSGYIRYVRDLP